MTSIKLCFLLKCINSLPMTLTRPLSLNWIFLHLFLHDNWANFTQDHGMQLKAPENLLSRPCVEGHSTNFTHGQFSQNEEFYLACENSCTLPSVAQTALEKTPLKMSKWCHQGYLSSSLRLHINKKPRAQIGAVEFESPGHLPGRRNYWKQLLSRPIGSSDLGSDIGSKSHNIIILPWI